jgi:hypothetical protein
MPKFRHIVSALTMALVLSVGTVEAQAPMHGPPDFHGRDFGGLGPRERVMWRGGAWIHDWHDGRYGWWWSVGGFWYFYPEPIYPYPTYIPPAIIVQQPPPVPTGLPPAQAWYYCDNPKGYYPYVASCNSEWRPVAITPPNAQPK